MIEQTASHLLKHYGDFPHVSSTEELQFYRSVITENLDKLDATVASLNLSPEVTSVYADKREKLLAWLNVSDCDLQLRQEDGKTLAEAPRLIREQAQALRANPEALKSWCKDQLPYLKDVPEGDPEPSARFTAGLVANMNPSEMNQQVEKNAGLFEHVDMATFTAKYAAMRWMNIRSEQAKAEGLDALLAEGLTSSGTGEEGGFFRELEECLATRSNRLDTALEILGQPAAQAYLTEKCGFTFTPDEPLTLEGVLRAHPDTRVLYDPVEAMQLTPDQTETASLLEQLDIVQLPEPADPETLRDLDNFCDARQTAVRQKFFTKQYTDEVQKAMLPMSTTRNVDELLAGDWLTGYEILQQEDPSGMRAWEKLGLGQEYAERFKTPEAFWQSDKSLLDIYRQLTADRDTKQSND